MGIPDTMKYGLVVRQSKIDTKAIEWILSKHETGEVIASSVDCQEFDVGEFMIRHRVLEDGTPVIGVTCIPERIFYDHDWYSVAVLRDCAEEYERLWLELNWGRCLLSLV